MLHPHSAWPSLVLAHTALESPTRRPQVLPLVKALSSVLFCLSWLCVAFLPFVLMFLSDLICIHITSPGGSPIRGKNAVRAFRHATPRHATSHHTTPLLSPLVTSTPSRPVRHLPIPILPSSVSSSPAPALLSHQPPHTSTLQSFPPVDSSITSLHCGHTSWDHPGWQAPLPRLAPQKGPICFP